MTARVGVLHHPRSFYAPDLHEAVGGAVELVWLLPDTVDEDRITRRLLPKLGTVVDVHAGDLTAAVTALQAHELQGIVTFVDDHLELTAALAQQLGLRYHTPEVAARIANKRRQRETLDAAGVAGPRFWSLPPGLSAHELDALSSRVSYPAVVKPAYGSGSRGIQAVADSAELIDACDPLLDQLVEEHMSDDPERDPRFASYLSVESVVCDAHPSHVAITGRFPLASSYRETGNFIPATVEPELQHELFALTDAAVAALEINTAVIHTEIKLTPAGARVIEVNGRLGGRPPFVLRSVSDVNLFQVACRLAAGEVITYPGPVPCREIGYWRMLQPPAGVTGVLAVSGLGDLRGKAVVDSVTVNRGAGQPVDVRFGSDGPVVTVRGRVSDRDQLASTIAMIDASVKIEYVISDPLL